MQLTRNAVPPDALRPLQPMPAIAAVKLHSTVPEKGIMI